MMNKMVTCDTARREGEETNGHDQESREEFPGGGKEMFCVRMSDQCKRLVKN